MNHKDHKKRILIVDDDPVLCRGIENILLTQGFVVEIALDGEQALEAVEKNQPDLLILDIQMPKINGYSFLFALRKIDTQRSIPIIVLTSKEEMRDIFMAEGVKEYLLKPFDANLLLEKINQYL